MCLILSPTFAELLQIFSAQGVYQITVEAEGSTGDLLCFPNCKRQFSSLSVKSSQIIANV